MPSQPFILSISRSPGSVIPTEVIVSSWTCSSSGFLQPIPHRPQRELSLCRRQRVRVGGELT